MTENDYKKLMIEMIRVGDCEEKESLLELLKFATIRFEKTGEYTRHLWNHYKEYIQVCIIPDKMLELKKHLEYLKDVVESLTVKYCL